jgi:hypothetical protein
MNTTEITLTDKIWDASRAPAVRELRSMSLADVPGRLAKADALTAQGFVLDSRIDVCGFSAPIVMADRLSLGLLWWPSYDQPLPVNALHLGSVPSNYDPAKPAAKSIITSIRKEDYPAFDQAPPPVPEVGPIGKRYEDGTYAPNIEKIWVNGIWLYQPGQILTAPYGVKVKFKKISSPFVTMVSWIPS